MPSLPAQRDALTLPRNLAELVDESDVIVQGNVTSVSLERHQELSNLVTVQVVIRVESALKGKPGETYTMRQAVLDPRDQQEKLGYRAGEHVLLILVKPNHYGLSSPAGLDQGRFRIQAGPDGQLQAINQWGNAGPWSWICESAALFTHFQVGYRCVVREIFQERRKSGAKNACPAEHMSHTQD